MTIQPTYESLGATLDADGVDAGLKKIILALADSVDAISQVIVTASTKKAGTNNAFGDEQLAVDVLTNKIVFDHLRASGSCRYASSEEETDELDMGGEGFSVSFDPLDGSSVVDANFAVGSIFGIWPGESFIGKVGHDQHAAMAAVYGPRTTIWIGLPAASCTQTQQARTFEVTLFPDHSWHVTHERVTLGEGKVFAPGNLRATSELDNYRRLVDFWITERYTLRYTGGMVPDVCHMFTKGKGVFCNPPCESAPAKLRLIYEVAPMALLAECAGGASADPANLPRSVLDRVVKTTDDRTGVCLGSDAEVKRFCEFMGGRKSS